MTNEQVNYSTFTEEYKEKAAELFKLKKYRESLEFLDKILEIDSNNFEILCDKGNVCYAMGSDQYENGYHEFGKDGIKCAQKCFLKAYQINNRYSRALKGLAKCYLSSPGHIWGLEKTTIGIGLGWINDAIENDSSDDEAWHILSGILLKLDRIEEAENAINKAIELNNNSAEYFHTKTVIYIHKKETENALKTIEIALKIEPNNPLFWKTKGVIQYYDKKYIEAIFFTNKAIELDPYFKKAIEDRNNAINKLKETGLSKSDINKMVAAFKYSLFSSQKDVQESSNYSIIDIDSMNGYQFELFLRSMFAEMGYDVKHTPLSGDQGADLVIEKAGARIVVQAKNQISKVGNKAIQEAVAAIKYYNANRAMVITNNEFTQSAIELAHHNNVDLIDRLKLQHLIEILRISKNSDGI